ncbi:MAG: hypothetical protein K9K86_11845 [Pseudomonadales bacterium]|nr:hypothetical protein [Pseudomonadales bacterium]
MTRAGRLTIRKAIIQAAEEKHASGSQDIVLTEYVVNALNKSGTPKRRESAKDMADAMAL